MKIRINSHIVAALMGSGALFLTACQGALAVVDDLDEPGSGTGTGALNSDAGSSSSGSSGPCDCAQSDVLKPLTCDGRAVPRFDNDIVQTSTDGSVVAFNVCSSDDTFACDVLYWDGSGPARPIGPGFMLGLSASGDDVLTSGSGAGLELFHLGGSTVHVPLNMMSGHGSLSAAGDTVISAGYGENGGEVLARANGITGEVERLGEIGGFITHAAVAPDARHAVGWTQAADDPTIESTVPFRWNDVDGLTFGVPGVPETALLWPEAISDDGSAIAGRVVPAGTHFHWNEADGYTEIAAASGRSETFISADGSVVLGSLDPNGPDNDDDVEPSSAFRWTKADGAVEIAPGISTVAVDMSDDGDVIVANSWEDAPYDVAALLGSFIWDSEHGTRTLSEILEARGADTSGWVLGDARVVSDDGKVLLGRGECGGVPTLYRVVLSE